MKDCENAKQKPVDIQALNLQLESIQQQIIHDDDTSAAIELM